MFITKFRRAERPRTGNTRDIAHPINSDTKRADTDSDPSEIPRRQWLLRNNTGEESRMAAYQENKCAQVLREGKACAHRFITTQGSGGGAENSCKIRKLSNNRNVNCDKDQTKTAEIIKVQFTMGWRRYDESVKASDTCSGKGTRMVKSDLPEGGHNHRGENVW